MNSASPRSRRTKIEATPTTIPHCPAYIRYGSKDAHLHGGNHVRREIRTYRQPIIQRRRRHRFWVAQDLDQLLATASRRRRVRDHQFCAERDRRCRIDL